MTTVLLRLRNHVRRTIAAGADRSSAALLSVAPTPVAGLRVALVFVALLVAGCTSVPDPGAIGEARPRQASEWPHYGGDAGGQRYSDVGQITRENVSQLEIVWTHHGGDVSDGKGEIRSTTAYENTPILVGGVLYICTPMNRVIAIDPVTGAEHWSYDPKIDVSGRYANQLICRGVEAWTDPQRADGQACRRTLFTATNDGRLIALDGATGRPCAGFGNEGEIDLNPAAGEQRWQGEYQMTSPPVLVGDVVVVGSAVGDNQRVDAPSGVVRGFDARTGALRWAWDAAPPGFVANESNVSEAGYALGTPNAWAPLSVDEERDLVFVPTGNPSPDYWRGAFPEMSYYGSSVVALRGGTGEVVWSFQTVHQDLWDYDVPAQPTLSTVVRDGREIPVVVQATKMGLIFVLDRETGKPVFPVEERPVPQNGAPGEKLSPTQPFPLRPPPLVKHRMTEDDAWGIAFFDKRACKQRIAELRNDGIYTPPTLQGSLMFPGNGGGVNWGGVAIHPERRVLVANMMEIPWIVRLFPREEWEATRRANPGKEISPQDGTPFAMWRELFMSPIGLPCVKPPWGTLAAVDMNRGEILWQVPFGTVRDLAPLPLPIKLGVPSLGGPVITEGGLVFIAAAMDDYFRAFDLDTGEELWKARLPAGGQATPMTYTAEGRQYVVIAAGGHGRAQTTLGDSLVAFALPH